MARPKGNGVMVRWVMVGIVLLTAAIAVGGMIATLNNHGERLDEAEPKIETVEKAVIKIQSDVGYILKGIEELKERP